MRDFHNMSGLLRTLAVSALVVCAAGQKSAGCGRNLPDGQQNGGRYNATVGGRRFLVNVPDDYNKDTPSPLVLAFHGGGGSPENHITVDQLTVQVKSDYPDLSMDIDDIFYVYPAGSSKAGCEQKNTCDKVGLPPPSERGPPHIDWKNSCTGPSIPTSRLMMLDSSTVS